MRRAASGAFEPSDCESPLLARVRRTAVVAAVVLLCPLFANAEDSARPPEERGEGAKKKKASRQRSPEIQGQIHVRYDKGNAAGDPDEGELLLSRAKFELKWQPRKRLDAALGVDLSPLAESGGGSVELGDAYLQIETWRWLRIRAGHRKIPFSAMRLTSRSRLSTVTRGEYGRQLRLVFNDEGPADLLREVGVDARFRLRDPRQRLDIGWSEGEDGPKDVAARYTLRPIRGLDLGASLAVIHVRTATGPLAESQRRFIGEADLAVNAGGWQAVVEGAIGDADDLEGDDEFAAGYALVSYRLSLGNKKRPALIPLVRFELVDQKLRTREDHAWSVTGGLNLIPRRFQRLMLDVEHIVRASRYGQGFNAADETRLLVQLAFDV